MVKQNDKILREGVVEESLPNGFFRVAMDDGSEALAHLAGKLRIFKIKILPGDRITVEFTPYDTRRGRIIFRKK
ncbi:translation initiation factor IF-1 [bacterium]|nr:translation initiation factor IF-1 [bacterium]